MESIYSLQILSGMEEYVELTGDFASIANPISRDELQYLTKRPMTFGLSDEGGLEFPDVLLQAGVLFTSDGVRNALLAAGQDQLFFKPANIVDDHFGIHETLWITVPPRIDCLDWSQTQCESYEWDCRSGLAPALQCARIVIDPDKAGHYEIFRLQGVHNDLIYVREPLKTQLESQRFRALSFTQRQQ